LEKKKKTIDDSTSDLRKQMKEVVDAREGKNIAVKECTK
jgi:hypothetical protein